MAPAVTDQTDRTRPDHRMQLPSAGGTWSAWRWAVLRGAGFPASRVSRLAALNATAVADRLLDAERDGGMAKERCLAALRALKKTAESALMPVLDKAWKDAQRGRVPAETGTAADVEIREIAAARRRADAARAELVPMLLADVTLVSAALREEASAPDLREALAWQNRNALRGAIAPLLAHGSKSSTSNHRRHEELVASYLQRYCTKNDTIGFFGPVGWALLGAPGERTHAAPGPSLVSHRSVHFEQWPIDELAKTIAGDARVAPWLRPRRYPFVRTEGGVVRSAVNGKHELTPAQLLLLAACDGQESARQLADQMIRQHPETFASESAVFESLGALREKLLIAWTVEVPLTWNPDEALRSILARIDDGALRAELTSPIDELDAGRRRVATAAGDAAALEASLLDLEATFTRVTGAAPTRNAGAMYAARQLVFEDCRRDVEATVGHDVLSVVGPALSLVLASARWLTFEAARVYREEFRRIHDDVRRRKPGRPVAFADVWFGAQRVLLGEKESPIAAIALDLQRRWSELLAFPPDAHRVTFDSETLAPRVHAAFAAPRPGWCQARHHSPDLMIAAPSIDAIGRGEYQVVLGELHVGVNTFDSACLVDQHPDPEELAQGFARDLPENLALSVYSKDWLRITVRTNRAFAPMSHAFVESGFDLAPAPRERVLSLSDLVVEERDGELVVCGPDDFALELVSFLGENMSMLVKNAFRMLPRESHSPRVTIDRLVVARETWRVLPSTMGFAFETTPEARFVEARRWARSLGLPRFVFAKSTLEVKPVYVDLASPIFITMFAKLVRRTKEDVAGETELSITEMLPGLDETWLSDAAGASYTSELRIVAFDESENLSDVGR